MPTPPVEPDSPVLYYDEEEPQLDGVRHLSVSSDGTIDSIISQDENPTPPQSPYTGPIVHISPPGAHLSGFLGGVEMEDSFSQDKEKERTPTSTPMPFGTPLARPQATFYADPGPPTPSGIKLNLDPTTPTDPLEPAARPSLAARRAASGKLPNKALLGLQQMRFESSRDAGMGLGVGPGSAGFEGMEGVSPGGPGMHYRMQMGLDDGKDGRGSRSTSPLPSPGVENIAVHGRSVRKSPSSLVLKIPRFGSSTSPLPSPTGDRAPPSPHIMRSSAFSFTNTGPRTPLTPSHLPPAPALGSGGPAFEWFSYSMPDSPGCPVPPEGVPVAEKTCYFSDLRPSSPSQQTAYLPTPGSERSRTPFASHGRQPIPASPLGQGRFAATSSNPFFA
ncbi:uncharacterized protein JCM10292_004593 [Rhodotorula paludigena]|uniref:uncharacterized protein n=1 Tax=Rhodotorula paludigena TaxID=86838 RepID=UPI003174EBED